MTPQTVNAVNLPLQNALNFPAAILQTPFFDAKSMPPANYGAIGAMIGHEISHSFDNLGADFDSTGKLRNWWTPADLAHFEAAGLGAGRRNITPMRRCRVCTSRASRSWARISPTSPA